MIASFKDAATRELWDTGKSRRIPSTLQKIALRKLTYLDSADELSELRLPPGNRLEALKGRQGGTAQHQSERPISHLLHMARKQRL